MTSYKKVGLIAGGGALPAAVLAGAQADGFDVFVAALNGFSDQNDFDAPSGQYRLGEFGKLLKALKKQKVDAITFAGIVTRPDFSSIRPDLGGMKYLPGIIKAASKGDDALLSHVTKIFEKEGIAVIGPQELCQNLVARTGALGAHSLSTAHMDDVNKACEIAKAIGEMDIGQGCVVSDGLVLAVEAQEGTDAMLARVAKLPQALRGTAKARRGVLAKMLKPGQEDRLDLPTIGLKTVQGAIHAGLAAIVLTDGEAFIMEREAVIAAADAAGLIVEVLPK